MWRVYKHTGKDKDYEAYKEALNAATNEVRKSKRNYEHKLAKNIKSDSKSFYAYVISKQNVRDKVGPLEDNFGNIVTQEFLMAEELNMHFSSVFTREDTSSLPVPETKFKGSEGERLGQLVVTPEVVASKINNMKENKSPGVNGISPKILKETVEQISTPLAHVFNMSLQEGIVQKVQADSGCKGIQGNTYKAEIKCVCLNARSILNKKNELDIMVDEIKPHIIGITESWANNDITDAELGLEGYVMFRKDRMGRRGGGVLLYIKETIPAYEVQLQEEADCKEAIWCKLVTGHTTVTIGVVYRCPNITKQNNEKIHNAISEVSKGDCIIMGDFNHGNIKWDTLQNTGVEDQQFLCLIQDNFLTQHVLEPTRATRVLDIVLSSQKELVDNVKIKEPLGSSDHNQIHFDINIKSDRTKVKQCRRDFGKGNYKEIRKSLALEWKEANIVPLFKKGSRNKCVNYKPVSLTSVICKLLETIIRDHMMDFLVKHKLINPSQHGFLKARSCLTNLLCFLRK